MSGLIQRDRLVKEFLELVAIDSVSFKERKMADTLKEKLKELNIKPYEDQANDMYHSEAGNVYGFLKGTIEGPPLLFSAHMDTVQPGIGKKAVLKEDGTITADGVHVLGSDDMAGVAAILEAIRTLQENHLPHRDIELLFPIAEEAYVKGSKVFDYNKIKAKEAYVLDLSGSVGTASLQEPTLISFQLEISGKAAHAGFAPEQGIHAITVAADGITRIRQGRIGTDTTVNLGTIQGGTATNIVPDMVTIQGEIRSYSHEKALEQLEYIRNTFQQTAKEYGSEIKLEHEIHLRAYQVQQQEPVVQRFLQVCRELQIPSALTSTFGGSDNNSFLQHGIRGIVLACGMNQVHTREEYTTIRELERSASIVVGLMQR